VGKRSGTATRLSWSRPGCRPSTWRRSTAAACRRRQVAVLSPLRTLEPPPQRLVGPGRSAGRHRIQLPVATQPERADHPHCVDPNFRRLGRHAGTGSGSRVGAGTSAGSTSGITSIGGSSRPIRPIATSSPGRCPRPPS
jgi:hypothetical protein